MPIISNTVIEHLPMKAFSKLELGFYAASFVSIFGIAALLKSFHSEDPLPSSLGDCDLETGVCILSSNNELNGTRVQFEDGIRLNRRINTELTLPASLTANASAVNMVLEGRDMYLGVYEYPLYQHNSLWKTKVVIPVCTQNIMQWTLRVQMTEKNGKQQEWAYLFDIEKPNDL